MAVRVFEMDHRFIPQPHGLPMMAMPFTVSQAAFSALADGTSRSQPFADATRVIVVQSDEKIAVRVGPTAPTALAGDYVIEAGGERAILVSGTHVLAARLI